MVDWEHFVKPLGFIALYIIFAAAVRAVLKPFFPNGANWIFILLLLAGLALMYYVYYEAFYFVKEILLPTWFEGRDVETADPIGGMLQPILYGMAILFFDCHVQTLDQNALVAEHGVRAFALEDRTEVTLP